MRIMVHSMERRDVLIGKLSTHLLVAALKRQLTHHVAAYHPCILLDDYSLVSNSRKWMIVILHPECYYLRILGHRIYGERIRMQSR